jgi:hypothetical protein
VRTRTGRELVVTGNHRFLLEDGWKETAELLVGDRIALAQRIPSPKGLPCSNAWILGLLLGDKGIFGKEVASKRVPAIIFQARKTDIADFLGGYFDSSGVLNFYGGGSLEFCSRSEGLLQDVQHLLGRFGIIASLSSKVETHIGESYYSFRLVVCGTDVFRFAEAISLQSSKRMVLKKLVAEQKKRGISTESSASQWKGDQPIFWDEVMAVEAQAPCMTWALQVPDTQTYLANDIVNHNTYFFDFAYVIWKAWSNPGGTGFIFSATKPQAERILEDIKNEIENNPKLAHLVPNEQKGRKWSSGYIRLSNGHRIYARGYGSRVRGAHPDYIIVDDGINDESLYSEMVRKKQSDYFFTAISNMIIPGGQILVVGTPFHSSDLYGELQSNPEYEFRKYPAIKSDGTPLWPDRYSIGRLEAKKREIGTIRFTREFMVDPVSDDMSLFPIGLFRGQQVELFHVRLGMPLDFWKRAGVIPYMAADFAISSNVKADYFVIFVLGLDKFGNRWIIDIARHHGMSYQDQLSEINRLGRKYEPALIFLESNQMQRIFGDELIRTTDLPIRKFETTAAKNALDKGVPSLRVLLENGKVRIPRGDKQSVELTDQWIGEMHAITFSEGKVHSTAPHDDTVMAFWICDQAIRHGGFQFTFGEEYGEPTQEGFQELMQELTGEDSSQKKDVGTPAAVSTVSLVDEAVDIEARGYPELGYV